MFSGGQRDEFNEKVAPLTSEQRDHLGQLTDELMKRYTISRSPGSSANGFGTNRPAVSSGRFKYPCARPSPPIRSSPAAPIGTGFEKRSTT